MVCVSIIIPVYNAEKYLKECMDSICSQTLKEIEVICIDDSSTDNSWEILQEYQKKYKNIIIDTQENSGSGVARNRGICLAQGEYLIFVDPDDYLAANDVLEVLYTKAKQEKVSVCGGSLIRNINGVLSKEFPKNRKLSRIENEGIFSFREYQYPYAHQRYIIKREFILVHNLFYPRYRRGQDVPFMANVLDKVEQFCLVNKNIYVYRNSHKVETFDLKKADEFISAMQDVLNLAIEKEYRNLFNNTVYEVDIFAKKYWYKLVTKNNLWNRINEVNEIIKKGNSVLGYSERTNYLMDNVAYNKYILKCEKQWKSIEDILKKHKKIALYGAGVVGRRIYKYLTSSGYIPECYIVSKKEENEKIIDGTEVVSIDEINDGNKYLYILCAANSEVKDEMKMLLKQKGYEHILDFNHDILECIYNA